MSFAREEGNAVLLTLFFRSLKKKEEADLGYTLRKRCVGSKGFKLGVGVTSTNFHGINSRQSGGLPALAKNTR